MEQLIVCGWDDDAEALLEALRVHAGLRATAIGDLDTASLVRARSATRLPCHQQVLQLIESAGFDAALIGTPELAAEVVGSAASRGGDILLYGPRMSARALEAAASAATRHDVALAILRPSVRNAGTTFLTELVATDPRWLPTVLDVEVHAEASALGALRDALSVATRLVGALPMTVLASAAGLDAADPLALSAQLRYVDGTLVTLSGRVGVAPAVRVTAQSPAGALELRVEAGQSRLRVTPWHGKTEESVQRDAPGMELEAERVARVRAGDDLDARLASREAAILRAIEDAVVSGTVEGVELAARSTFRVLAGGVEASSPRLGALHLV